MHSFASLLADLATICLNTIAPADPALPGFRLVTTPTAFQRHAFGLLGVATALASRSQQPAPDITKAQVIRANREILAVFAPTGSSTYRTAYADMGVSGP